MVGESSTCWLADIETYTGSIGGVVQYDFSRTIEEGKLIKTRHLEVSNFKARGNT